MCLNDVVRCLNSSRRWKPSARRWGCVRRRSCRRCLPHLRSHMVLMGINRGSRRMSRGRCQRGLRHLWRRWISLALARAQQPRKLLLQRLQRLQRQSLQQPCPCQHRRHQQKRKTTAGTAAGRLLIGPFSGSPSPLDRFDSGFGEQPDRAQPD